MTYRVTITKTAKKDVDSLEHIVRKRVGKKLLQIAQLDDFRPLAKQLTNSSIGEYRIRIGDYRILFDCIGKELVILRVQHRKDVYR